MSYTITHCNINTASQKEKTLVELAKALQANAKAVSDLAKAIENNNAPSYGVQINTLPPKD